MACCTITYDWNWMSRRRVRLSDYTVIPDLRKQRNIMRKAVFLIILLLSCIGGPPMRAAFDDPPTEWVDPSTGHRVVRLSREPNSASLYFHQNAYSPDGRKLVITTPAGLSTID